MRLVFLGSDAIALPSLAWLRTAPGVELAAVYSQPDRPSGRGKHLHANPVAAWARAHGVPLRQPDKPGPAEAAWLRDQAVALALVMAYGHLLRQEFLDAPAHGAWNLHGSLLPAYRGATPVEAVLAAGENVTGVSLMRMVAALDAGPVADVEPAPIFADDTAPLLRARLAAACLPLLARNFAALMAGALHTVPQDGAGASYTRKLTKADARLDFAATAASLARRIRALQPWPGATCEYDGETLKIGAALNLPERCDNTLQGKVLRAGPEGLDVAAGGGVLRLLGLQRPGGRMLSAADYLHGHAIPVGAVLLGGPMRPLVSPRPFVRQPAPRKA